MNAFACLFDILLLCLYCSVMQECKNSQRVKWNVRLLLLLTTAGKNIGNRSSIEWSLHWYTYMLSSDRWRVRDFWSLCLLHYWNSSQHLFATNGNTLHKFVHYFKKSLIFFIFIISCDVQFDFICKWLIDLLTYNSLFI